MSTTVLERPSSAPTGVRDSALRLSRETVLGWIGLAAIVALAAVLRFSNLGALGYANHYYTAGITSMLQSWHNFFFVAAEPGGAVSIDKPPVGLWLQAFSAYFLGVNGFAVLLPEILAGLASVVVLYHLVRRSFGTVAGWLAALALAITPIVAATDRNNTMDSTLILTLLLSAWAFIKATESRKLRYLLLGAVLVGIGFNIKMLQAYLPLPAFYALYFLGASDSLRRKIVNLALATVVLLTVSFSWAVAVDLTPADQRPYVGSSGSNSVLELALGYNGIQRLTGMGGSISSFLARLSGSSSGSAPRLDGNRNGNFPPPGQDGSGQFQPPNFGAGGNGQPPQPGGGGFGGGFPGTGQPGALRLFTAPLSKEMSWLLPFGLFSAGLLLVGTRPPKGGLWVRWPLATEHQALVLWGGWLVIGGVFFSIAGFFHEYYLSMLAAPLAALVGIGAIKLWRMRERHPWLAIGLLLLAAGATLAFQAFTATSFISTAWWLPFTILLFVMGAALLVTSAGWQVRYTSVSGFACVMAALLLTPGLWSGLTTLNSSDNQSLPAAYSGRASGPANNGDLQINQALLDYLTANTRGIEYLMAVPSSMQGADYVIATGRPVLYLGGFSGQDKVVTAGNLAQMVAHGELRYIYWNASGGNGFGGQRGNQSDISAWLTSACTPVQGYDTATISAGAPDGVRGGLSNGGIPFGGGRQMQMTLYACGA
jgi:4-amino-4-deoxy-L-arabinose transferase-like glycosyltransferase